MPTTRILVGDVLRRLRDVPTKSVQAVVTSPPYWGLRDYGTGRWEGGDAKCDHVEKTAEQAHRSSTLGSGRKGHPVTNAAYQAQRKLYKGTCRKCGARRIDHQIGQEPTPEEYVATMVRVFRKIERILRDDGLVWLNLGDTYAAGCMTGKQGPNAAFRIEAHEKNKLPARKPPAGMKSKDLVGIPWMVAFALRADGWYLRQDIVWSKANPMPESIKDRCTKAHEYVFLLAKRSRYFFDAEAIKEKSAKAWNPKKGFGTERKKAQFLDAKGMNLQRTQFAHTTHHDDEDKMGRNCRSVWHLTSHGESMNHFALMPKSLATRCIKASTSDKGACAKCGAPLKRKIKKVSSYHHTTTLPGKSKAGPYASQTGNGKGTHDVRHGVLTRTATAGWVRTCKHRKAGIVPCIVFDPFGGGGTTALTANRLRRNAIIVELNPKYAEAAQRRVRRDGPLSNDVRIE